MQAREVSDFASWREAARELLQRGVQPESASFLAPGETPLLPGLASTKPAHSAARALVPREFLEHAELVALHRDPGRWALLYRLLWRITHGEPALLEAAADAEVQRLHLMGKAVRRDEHKMHAFVRFRRVQGEVGEHFIAYHRPDHHIVRLAAPFFARRFASMRWTILTPDESATWDGAELRFGPGAPASASPDADALEDLWRTYYANIFNPARLNLARMTQELPRRHWATLPEATLIAPLARAASQRVGAMLAEPESASSAFLPEARTLDALRGAIGGCRACGLCERATQPVFGEGPNAARVMLIGEQPGDQEDLMGRPFVGPAGQVLDEALVRVGIPRAEVYVTNAVKHFKFEERGKKRIHQKPSASEIRACNGWLLAEIEAVKPRHIVCLGATAAQALMGPRFSLTRSRGQVFPSKWAPWWLATYHPSALLRMEDAAQRERARAHFLEDLAQLARARIAA